MTLSHKTLLTISCISLSLHSMEQPKKQTVDLYRVSDIYKKTYTLLEKFDPTNNQSIIDLSQILTKIDALKSYNIEEKDIRQFAYKQTEPLSRLLPFEKSPYNGPHYVGVFFEQITQYNKRLKKTNSTSPTLEQLTQYRDNQKIEAIITKATTFRLFNDLKKRALEKKIIVDISSSIATQEFGDLMDDIALMKLVTPEEIKTIAHILYDDIKEEPIDTSKDTPEKL